MSFRDLDIEYEYRSLLSDVVRDFYTPVLKESVLYQRAVGFFSSSSLICLTEGLRGLIENEGRMEIIASPKLTPDDIEAIREGNARKDEVIVDCLLRELEAPKGKFEEARLNLLANLISSGILELKIAFLESGSELGMFHEKLGLMHDADGNVIAFSGSMNETANAYYNNYEAIDVYLSWDDGASRIPAKESAFSAMWSDYEPHVRVMNFPEIEDAVIQRYQIRPGVNVDDLEVTPDDDICTAGVDEPTNIPSVPKGVCMRDYQLQAIQSWENNGYKGIFDMATGTGKTYTALAAIAHISDSLSHRLAVVIVCPYQHLVEQWREDIVAFGMRPIVCYSASNQTNWRDRVKNSVGGFRMGALERFCMVTTNATFSTEFMQKQIGRLRGNCLLVVDEAHNFGSEKLAASLPKNFPYRLALSATLDRHGDEYGTSLLYTYFGEKCIEYSLADAINNNMLTPYYYHPVTVTLDDSELEEYLELTEKIGKAIASSGSHSMDDLPDGVKMLLIKRARIVAGASQKIPKLAEIIKPMAKENHLLVYCGATSMHDVDYQEGTPTESDSRQIDVVTSLLGNTLGMKVSQFTSNESAEKRELLKREFAEGRQEQALIAIRCLDEGVNIPSIEKAFILASGTNPKEYVQRRGRVLRKSPGKKHAVIYDFVTLPIDPDDVGSYDQSVVDSSKSLVKREISRMQDFASISENPSEAMGLTQELLDTFDIEPEELEEESYV